MKSLRLWWAVVLILFLSVSALAPREARAEKDLGITEKHFIASCNKCLNLVNLRFIKNEKYKEWNEMSEIKDQWTGSYDFYNGLAPMYLSESSGQLTEIWLIISSGQKSATDTPIVIPIDVVTCTVSAILPAKSDSDRFRSKLRDNLLQGLDKFVIKVKGRAFEVYNSPLGSLWLTIRPAK